MSIRTSEKWRQFAKEFSLTPEMEDNFILYVDLLKEWNEIHNLTAIEGNDRIIVDHLADSLSIANYYDMGAVTSIADVGAGPGIPGIPLKIRYPHLSLYLIEVNQKKVAFLETVIEKLALQNATVIDLDWRTFLRKTTYQIDLFVSRAALEVEELVRCLKPGSFYHNATLIYWASKHWQPNKREEAFLTQTISYRVGNKDRVYAFFKKQS